VSIFTDTTVAAIVVVLHDSLRSWILY